MSYVLKILLYLYFILNKVLTLILVYFKEYFSFFTKKVHNFFLKSYLFTIKLYKKYKIKYVNISLNIFLY